MVKMDKKKTFKFFAQQNLSKIKKFDILYQTSFNVTNNFLSDLIHFNHEFCIRQVTL